MKISIKTYRLSITLFVIVFYICPSLSQTSEIQNYQKLADKYIKEGNQVIASNYLNKIAYIYWNNNQLEEAISYFNQTLTINKSIGNNNGVRQINFNIASIYAELEKYDQENPPNSILLKMKKSSATCFFENDGIDIDLEIYLTNSRNGFKIEVIDAKELTSHQILKLKSKMIKKSYHSLDFYGIPINSIEDIIHTAHSYAHIVAKGIISNYENNKKRKKNN